MNRILKTLITSGLLLLISLLMVAPTTQAQGVALNGQSIFDVNIRTSPGVTSGLLGVLPAFEEARAIGRSPANNWIQIEYQATTGWVASWLLVFSGDTALLPVTTDTQPPPANFGGPYAAISPYNVNIRSAPDTNSDKIGRLPFGTEAEATGRNEASSWVRIEYQGQEGWVAGWLMILNGDINGLPVDGGAIVPPPTDPDDDPTPTPTDDPDEDDEDEDTIDEDDLDDDPLSDLPPTGITVYMPHRVNVRSAPALVGTVLDILDVGQTVDAVGRNEGNNWIQVHYGATTGWVAAWVVVGSEATSALPVTNVSAQVAEIDYPIRGWSAFDLVVRAGPDLTYGTVDTLTAGTEVTPLYRTPDTDWIWITYDGGEGWVAAWILLMNADFLNLEVDNGP